MQVTLRITFFSIVESLSCIIIIPIAIGFFIHSPIYM